jgi:hypothetical protein
MKRLGVDKANARIVGMTATAAFLVIFFLVASYSLLGQLTYQNRIISAKKTAVNQLKKNITARDSLVKSFTAFAGAGQNFIGGSSTGSGPQDGSNSRLVLDALPSKYDYPALATSLEKIATDQRVGIDSMNGIDDEIAQSSKQETESSPIEMPFVLKTASDYAGAQRLVDALDRSIRPIKIQKIQITGDSGKINLDTTGSSYYLPAKQLTLRTKVVK